MTSEESLVGAVAAALSNLAKGPTYDPKTQSNGTNGGAIELPGPDSVGKSMLENELGLLVTRIRNLEARAQPPSRQTSFSHRKSASSNAPPINGSEITPQRSSPPSRMRSGSTDAWLSNFLDSPDGQDQELPPPFAHLTAQQAGSLKTHVKSQKDEIGRMSEAIGALKGEFVKQNEELIAYKRTSVEEINRMHRELQKHQQANLAFQKALREIGNIVTAVANGDLSKKVLVHKMEMDPEIGAFKKTINTMVDQLQEFASQVSFLAKEVGTEGRLGGQASLPEVKGIWAELTENVNVMAENLTQQVREIAVVTTAVAHGDLSRKIERPAKGEILQLQQTINTMVDQLRTFATEVTRVARDVGTEGVLGGQAQIEGVQGMWNDLTINVNAMANNLTMQVRDIAKVTTAVAKGDLTQKVTATCKGEILDLKSTINAMVDQLQQFAHEVTNLAQEVGTEGRLGGQATVHGVEGTWRDLTQNVNVMAMKLTTQVREIAEVTTAVARGDLSRKVGADVKGEILSLKNTINNMVDQLGTFAFEVSKVAREVGTEGVLGGQAKVENVEGKWKDLTDNVNTMAQNLTGQVRSISDVTQAIAKGDLSRKIHVHAQGEILLLKTTINGMVSRLDSWSLALKGVARDVGVDGKMGGQAPIIDLEGRWKEITVDVNTMAQNLTSQVRAFADITNAANSGDFTQEITIAASGEMDELKRKINKMVSGLRESIEKNAKAREVAEQANSTKSQFLANMSHEIRTPMNGIIGMTQLTLDSDLTNYQRDMLNTVHQLANSLLTIIDDILDISKIEANRMEVDMQPFSVRMTIYNALKSLVVKANDKALNLGYEVDSKTLDYLRGDSLRLRQIITNLVGNAVKFTENGEVKVSVLETSQAKCTTGEYMMKFAVSDTGIGIQQESLHIIFDSFKQADNSTTRQFGGTGLGLSISKRLVNLHGGDMWVESKYGSGSTFFFTCKFRTTEPSPEAINAQLKPYQNYTVLFIDQGNIKNVEAICDMLRAHNLVPLVLNEPDLGSDPEFPSINGQIYDCVVVDNNGMAKKLRKIEKFKYVPIVMMAPIVSVGFKSALEDGISSYMTTPCVPIDLANALVPALEGRVTPQKSDHSGSFNILLAEDNPINQKLAIQILEKYQHKVTVANNGLEAFEVLKAHSFDVVLMDVQMPVMGGFEATSKIREWEKANKVPRTPILALTAHAMLGDREKCLQAEMDDYLSKPLKRNMLIQCIVKYATMSGAMLDNRRVARRSLAVEPSQQAKSGAPNAGLAPPTDAQALARRPKGPLRGATDVGTAGLASPAIVADEKLNPFDKSFG